MWLQGHWYNGWSDLTGNRVAIKVAVVANNKMLIRKVRGMISGTGCARGIRAMAGGDSSVVGTKIEESEATTMVEQFAVV